MKNSCLKRRLRSAAWMQDISNHIFNTHFKHIFKYLGILVVITARYKLDFQLSSIYFFALNLLFCDWSLLNHCALPGILTVCSKLCPFADTQLFTLKVFIAVTNQTEYIQMLEARGSFFCMENLVCMTFGKQFG